MSAAATNVVGSAVFDRSMDLLPGTVVEVVVVGGGMTAVTVVVRNGDVTPAPEAVALFVTSRLSMSAVVTE